MRRTKIIATLGPASASDTRIRELIAAGVDVFRLNFSHGSHDSHAAMIEKVRRIANDAGRIVALLQDLSGPKIRIGKLRGGGPVTLKDGEPLSIVVGDIEGDVTRSTSRRRMRISRKASMLATLCYWTMASSSCVPRRS